MHFPLTCYNIGHYNEVPGRHGAIGQQADKSHKADITEQGKADEHGKRKNDEEGKRWQPPAQRVVFSRSWGG